MLARVAVTLISLPIGLLVASSSWGQEADPPLSPKSSAKLKEQQRKLKIGDVEVGLAVPDSPAFAILNLTPETVIRPTTPRLLALLLLNGLDPKGNPQTGLAIETSLYVLFFGRELALPDYRENADGFNADRFASKIKFSLATAKGEDDDDESLKLTLGLTLTPWDRSDPRLNDEIFDCFSAPFAEKYAELDEIEGKLAKAIATGQDVAEFEKQMAEID